MLKKLFFTLLLLLGATTLSAQPIGQSQDDNYTIELRQKLNIDYTLPDFSTSKLDGKVIGTRLALMLQRLQANYRDGAINQFLSKLVCEQNDGLNYVTIENLKIQKISKTGNLITIMSNAKLSKNPLKLKNTEICMAFTKGVSDNKTVNSLFSNLARYIKEE